MEARDATPVAQGYRVGIKTPKASSGAHTQHCCPKILSVLHPGGRSETVHSTNHRIKARVYWGCHGVLRVCKKT